MKKKRRIIISNYLYKSLVDSNYHKYKVVVDNKLRVSI